MMVRVHLTSLHLKGSTKTPLRGDKERPVRLRTTGGLAAARTGDPQSIRGTRAPEAPRPLRRIPKNRTGEGRSLAHANADADAGATTPSGCLEHPQHRRWSATRGLAAHPKCACGAHVVCVLWWCSRPGRAPRRTGIAAEAIRCCGANAAAEYARANEVLCGALWPQPAAQQALQQVSVSLLHVLAADLGAALARWRPCRPSVVPGPLQRRLLGSAPRPAPAHLTNTPTLTSTSGAKRPETESRRRRAGPRPRGVVGVLPEDAKKTRVALQNLAPGMNWP